MATPAYATQPAPPNSSGAPVPDSYFTESRKGEINELRNLLRSFATERDPQRKRDIIKKVIAYMTLGIDVSRLFTEMMLAIETRDLVIKKMVYLYLTNYARTNPELAQMCTNTLQKDCGNEDPMVRGLALRALCGLHLPQMVEYIGEPLRRALSDGHAYVRKTGVLGVLKLYHLDPDGFEASGLIDVLYDMLRDPDASVVCNCIIVLNEVMSKTGGMAINRPIMLHLLNRIHEFNEFAKVQVLELVPRYIPANEDEGYQIMNLLDPVLRTSSSGAVMASIRAFLSLAEHLDPNLRPQIIERVKVPLITHISAGSSELMFSLLKHVLELAATCPGVLDDEYRQFYVRYNEPTHVKYLKVQILALLASPDTAPDIVSELAELVADKNEALSRLAVQSMGKIACGNRGGDGAAEAIARRLVELLDLNVDHVSAEAAASLTLMIRKHPSLRELVAPPLVRTLRYVTESSGKASIVNLIGDCGALISEAPYALEKLIDSYDTLEDANVKLALLTATMKLFFLRAPETQRMLGRLLAKACDDVSSQDLHDRALLYYRMLKSSTDPSLIESVVRSDNMVTMEFAEDDDVEHKKELLEEFNTLATIYGKPSVNFIAPEFQVVYKKMPEEHPLAADSGIMAPPTEHHVPDGTTPVPLADAGEVDLLGFGGPSEPLPAAPAPTASVLSLSPGASLSGDQYQSMWGSISDADAVVSTIPLPSLPPSTDHVEHALAGIHIMTMASGELPNEFKFFLYAQDAESGSYLLIQSNIDKSSPHDALMIVTIKVTTTGSDSASLADQLVQTMASHLA